MGSLAPKIAKSPMGYLTQGSKRNSMSLRRSNWKQSDLNQFKDTEPINAEGADLESNQWGVRRKSTIKDMHKIDKMKCDKAKAKADANTKEAAAKSRRIRGMFKKKTRQKYER